MFDLAPATLRYFSALPTQDPLDFSKVDGPLFSSLATQFFQEHGAQCALNDALTFYASSHLRHGLSAKFSPDEILPDDVAKVCHEGFSESLRITTQTFFQLAGVLLPYFQMAGQAMMQNANYRGYFESKYSPEIVNFFDQSKTKSGPAWGWGYDHNFTMLKNFPGTINDFFTIAFDNLTFGKVYNMPRWNAIAALGKQCTTGQISMLTCADQTFSIQHYGGSVFIKGIFYKIVNDQKMYHILDVQDSGQIFKHLTQNPPSDPHLKHLLAIAKKYIPEACTGAIDQKLIQASQKKREGKLAPANFGGAGGAGINPPVVAPKTKAQMVMEQQNKILLGVKPK